MGTEYRVHAPHYQFSENDLLEIPNSPSFWKKEKKYEAYYLGKIENSEWPVLSIWIKDGDIGITLNGSEISDAWRDLTSFLEKLKKLHISLEISDWDD